MTSYAKPTTRPDIGRFNGFDHIKIWCSNAKQAASFYVTRFGFEYYAYSGLETGSREEATHVVKQNDIMIAFTSPLNPVDNAIGKRVAIKGDAVKDVAFQCHDVEALYKRAVERGAKSLLAPTTLKDEHGSVVIATVETYGDTAHTFIQRNDYKGCFLPGFRAVNKEDPLSALLPSPKLDYIDHVVGNQGNDEMVPVCDWYEKILGFHRFWSVDDKQMHTEFSALRSIVMSDFDEKIKMPINEPAPGKRKSQIQEYVDYHGEGGVQHIALNTQNIIHAITTMKKRGLEFLTIPRSYYDDLRKRLKDSPVNVAEDLDVIQELNILVDFDDNGYLLQIFTKPVEDRPTLFYEVIQRRNHEGFGAGNFKALFEAIERDQGERGNLEN